MHIDDDLWTRALIPGTSGWTSNCFANSQFALDWVSGRFEIIEGILARCTPGYFTSAVALTRLLFQIRDAAEVHGIDGDCCPGVEMILNTYRVVRADGAFLTPHDLQQQEVAEKVFKDGDERRYRILVPPTIVIEATSAGYELHDTCVKKRFYAEFGVPNYWILDQYHRTLTCLRLQEGDYIVERSAAGRDEVLVSYPFEMTIRLTDVFYELDKG